MTTGGHSMQIALTEQDVVDALKFDSAAIFRFEQNRITHFDTSHVRANSHDLGPIQASPHLRSRRDHDAATRSTFAILASLTHQHAIVQEFDGDRPVGARSSVGSHSLITVGCGQRRRRPKSLMATKPATTTPATATRSGRMPPYSSVNQPLTAPRPR